MPASQGKHRVDRHGTITPAPRRGEGYRATWRCGHNAEPAPKLEGGYIPVRTIELCMAWGLLLGGDLRPFDIRVWLAVHELRARRAHAGKDRAPRYRVDELTRLVGGGGGTLKASLRRLRATRLVRWSEGGPEVATSPEELVTANLEPVWGIYRAMPAKRKRVPVPRRVLRLLAGGVKRSVLATALGQLVCCLFYHRGKGWNPKGSCKASWIAETFGLSERSVIRARQHLEGLGWLRRVESPGQWHLNRYGATYEVNLLWARTAEEFSKTHARQKFSTAELSPPCARNGTRLSPPESDQTLSTRRNKHQNPSSGGSAGVSRGKGGKKKSLPKATLRNLIPEDLASVPRLMELFDQAVSRGLVREGFMERLNFAAAAEHARVRGSSNPCGLFFHVVSKKLWHYITDGDEEAVRRKVTAHLNGEPLEDERRRGGEEWDAECEPAGISLEPFSGLWN